MKTGTDKRKELILYAVLGVFMLGACGYVYEELFAGSTSSPAPQPTVVSAPAVAAPSGPVAKKVGTTSAALDPTLHMDAMLASEAVEYSGTGRNIFSPTSAPTVPMPIAQARPKQLPVAQNLPPRPAGPPPPPPIALKFFGIATGANGQRQAFLLHDDSVYTAAAGDVLLRRYRVLTVDAKSIQVEDLQTNSRQTLPLLAN